MFVQEICWQVKHQAWRVQFMTKQMQEQHAVFIMALA